MSNGLQRYKCNGCGKQFCEKGFFARLRHKTKDIMNALWLIFHRLSFREAKKTMKKFFGLRVSHVSIYRWFCKFVFLLDLIAKQLPLQFTKIWHVDEKYVKVKGSKDDFAYLWLVIDSLNRVIAQHLSNARNER
jgi:transposase-like protein